MEKRSFYRPEIDGLRALAIIPVILFHAGIAGFEGGFVGVDIFFVISGYLITSILLREMGQDSFSLVKFWERRVRRIVPAMFFITSIVLIGAYFIILFPVDFVDFGQSLVAQSLFLANIFFMRKSNYFAAPSESMPLLHTWSLSVEEQFYILFPILVLLLWFVSKRIHKNALVLILLSLAVLSVAYNIYLTEIFSGGAFSIPFISYIWGSATNANAGFFFPLARAWELLLGALLATGFFAIRNRWMAEFFSCLGLAGIVFAIVAYGDTIAFPGFFALIPTLGCVLIIWTNTHVNTAVGQLLSFPLLVWIGLISFSLYLWHWPLIVFSKTLFGTEAQNYIPIIVVLTFALSWFTYKFVETPFRIKAVCTKTPHMFLFGFGAVASLTIAGLLIHTFNGFPSRASDASHAIAAAAVDTNPRDYECFRKNYREIFSEGEPCILGDQTDTNVIDFVLWGDSHSDAAMPVVDALALEAGETGAYFGSGGCGPVLWKNDLTKDEKCKVIKEQAVAYIKEHSVQKVLLIASWESSQVKSAANGNTGRIGGPTAVSENARSGSQTFLDALGETVDAISSDSNKIYIMKKVPVYQEYDVRKAFNKAAHSGDPFDPILKTYAEYLENNSEENQAIEHLASLGKITVIDPGPIFCPEGVCSNVHGGKIIYKDGGHLNTTGAMLLKPVLEDFFAN